MDIFDLQGKTAIVTGGNKGLGLGISEGLCEAGAAVAIVASSDSVHGAASELAGRGYKSFGIQADLSSRDSLATGFEEAVSLLGGRLDILVNNAGIQRRARCEDFSL
ncbi:MAG TPA: 2-deoxy-D-gluconate 3-dehydrogenase, partial [Spirochaetaceae bacterium]|nr:2-deoxy-D-gluconate 3-dehydrogenase [Spirochaetaceae bacterium]